ncbi:MAG: hypothetical protein ACREIU_15880 [Planctomycetota bacterium]
MSAFTVGGKHCASAPLEDSATMQARLCRLARRRTRIGHKYDVGSTTALALRVVSEVATEAGGEPVRLVARNAPPRGPCASCGVDSERICALCGGNLEVRFCGTCADEHDCEEPSFLPVVDSPRAGLCAYGT